MRTIGFIFAGSLAAILLASGAAARCGTAVAGLASAVAEAGESRSPADGGTEFPVRVETDKSRYQQGETIFVTLRNGLSAAIYAPPQETSICSVVTIEKRTAGRWARQGACDPGDAAISITLQPNSEMTASLSPIVQHGVIQGPFWGKPTGARVAEGDLRDLPPVEPLEPGRPLREVPQAERPSQTDFFGVLEGALTPGTYRISFRFTVGSRSQPRQTVHSEAFHVEG